MAEGALTVRRLLHVPGDKPLLAITLAALAVTAGLAYAFGLIHRPMAPYSILDLEFAWTPARLAAMTAAWGEAGDAAARLSLWVDFVYMPAYACLFAGLTLMAARAAAGRWQTLGLWLALAPFAAWACDALENVMLLGALPPSVPSAAALTVAGVAAGVKFGLLALCLLYLLAALPMRLLRPRVKREA